MKKNTIVLFIIAILCLTTFTSTVTATYNNTPFETPKSTLLYVLPPIVTKMMNYPYTVCIPVKDLDDIPFPYPTEIFFGSLIGLRPNIDVTIWVSTHESVPPDKVDVYSDDEYYDTVTGVKLGPISMVYYPVNYSEKGFHHLKFVPDGNESASLEINVQIGLKGIIGNVFRI